jgi:hypothetical protein
MGQYREAQKYFDGVLATQIRTKQVPSMAPLAQIKKVTLGRLGTLGSDDRRHAQF